jgi:hypothetical protein
MDSALNHSRALWNRAELDLGSDEMLAQVLDRGSMQDWRELYRLAQCDPRLRTRIKRIVSTVPVPLPQFWLAALASLGEPIENWSDLPDYYSSTAP